jgi:glycosyltransferase involved in cell wall biosynthesis
MLCTMGYPPDQTGGAEHQTHLQARELSRRGYQVQVVAPARDRQRSGLVDGVAVTRLPATLIDTRGPRGGAATARTGLRGVMARLLLLPNRVPVYQLALFAYLLPRLRNFDVVHIHMASSQALPACLAAWLCRRPVLTSIASGGDRGDLQSLSGKPIERRIILARTRLFQALSDEIEAELRAAGVGEKRILRLPNGVDTERWRPASAAERREARDRLDLPPDRVVVLYTGRFARTKGLAYLVEAWRDLDAANAVLVLVGRRRTDRRSPVSDAGAPASIIVRDWVPDLQDYYAAADIFVLPSGQEGMSNVTLEAMACGLPVVTTRVGAAEQVVEPERTGLLVDVASAEQLRVALGRLIDDAVLGASLGRAARHHVAASYGIGRVVDGLEAAYARLVGAGV